MIFVRSHLGGVISDGDFGGTWEDLQGPVAQGLGNAVLTYEQYRSAPFKCYFMRHDQNDELNYVLQLRHAWMRGSSVKFHVHCTPMSTWVGGAATKDIYWTISYCWTATGAEVPDAIGWTVVPVTLNIPKTDQFLDKIYPLLTMAPPVGAKESSILRIQVIRSGTSGSDTYDDNKTGGTGAANLAIWDFDAHFQQDKSGTATELPP